MSSMTLSAFSVASLGLMPPRGCSITVTGKLSIPNPEAHVSAKATNSDVIPDTVGIPLFSSSTEPWTSQAVHAPQSPAAEITTSAF